MYNQVFKEINKICGFSSVVEYLASMLKVLSSVPSTLKVKVIRVLLNPILQQYYYKKDKLEDRHAQGSVTCDNYNKDPVIYYMSWKTHIASTSPDMRGEVWSRFPSQLSEELKAANTQMSILELPGQTINFQLRHSICGTLQQCPSKLTHKADVPNYSEH